MMAQMDNGVLDRDLPESRNVSIDEILASATPSPMFRSGHERRSASNLFAEYNVAYEFPGCSSTARVTGLAVAVDRSGDTPRIASLSPICSSEFVMRSGFLSTQASIVTYACSNGHFFNKYIVYASMGTNNQVWRRPVSARQEAHGYPFLVNHDHGVR
jgi:hypothetical protein